MLKLPQNISLDVAGSISDIFGKIFHLTFESFSVPASTLLVAFVIHQLLHRNIIRPALFPETRQTAFLGTRQQGHLRHFVGFNTSSEQSHLLQTIAKVTYLIAPPTLPSSSTGKTQIFVNTCTETTNWQC